MPKGKSTVSLTAAWHPAPLDLPNLILPQRALTWLRKWIFSETKMVNFIKGMIVIKKKEVG